jgi:hypothetical protein
MNDVHILEEPRDIVQMFKEHFEPRD